MTLLINPRFRAAALGHLHRPRVPQTASARTLNLIFLFLACFTLAAGTAFAQEPFIEWNVDALVVEPGESVDTQLILTNTAVPETPEAQVPDGVRVQLLSPNPATMSQTSIINNVMTQSTTYTYTLRLTGVTEGIHQVGPIAVRAGGKTYTADPIRLTVRKAAPAQAQRGDQFVFVSIDVEPTTLYVSQSYRATLTIGIRKVVINGRRVEMDLLRTVDGTASDLWNFPRSGWTSSPTVLTDSTGRRNEYDVFRITTTLQANDIGTTLVGPVFIRANYPLAVRRSFFGEEVTKSRRESARAEGVAVTVKAPPPEGRPDDYSGALGHFEMKVDAQPRRVEQGQPVTLTIAFRGAPLGGIAPPDRRRLSDLASRFDYTQDELVGDMDGEWKVFRRAIFPRQAGEQTVPAISWSYFDTASERYVTLSSEPIPIVVDAPKAASGPSLSFSLPTPPERESELTVLTGGISPNYIDPDVVLVKQSFVPGAAHAIAFASPPIVYLALFLMIRRRERLRTDAGGTRRRKALKSALTAIQTASRLRDPAEQMRALAQTVADFVSDRFNLASHALTPAEVRTALTTHGVRDELVREVVTFLDQADALRYAGHADAATMDGAAERVLGWLTELERQT